MPTETFAATLRRLIAPAKLDTPDVDEWTFDSAIHARERLRDFLEGHAESLAELVEAVGRYEMSCASVNKACAGNTPQRSIDEAVEIEFSMQREMFAALKRLEEIHAD